MARLIFLNAVNDIRIGALTGIARGRLLIKTLSKGGGGAISKRALIGKRVLNRIYLVGNRALEICHSESWSDCLGTDH